MLQEMHIQNYAVIENLTLEFHAGLNVLTGETGSGKSVLVDALDLALGGRATSDVIRNGADRASVTVVFRVEMSAVSSRKDQLAMPPWFEWLERYGISSETLGEIILRREIQSNGRSRLLVNDQPVTLAAARELAPLLVEVHGQGEHASLLLREAQLNLLDAFARNGELLATVRSLFARRKDLEREWTQLNQSEQERLRALDLLRFQVDEIDKARLVPGEDERLESERLMLRNIEKVRSAAAGAYATLYEDEGSALERISAVTRSLDELVRYDPTLDPHREPIIAAQAALDDLARALGSYLGRLEVDPGRRDEVEERLALLDRLKRKYGGTVNEILAFAERAREELARVEQADARRDTINAELASVDDCYRKVAAELSRDRHAAATRLAREVRRELTHLGMEKARFEVKFEEIAADAPQPSGGSTGIDRLAFLLSANPGEQLRPLDMVASGGELSRLILALKTVIGAGAAHNVGQVRTLVFDEVDAGIGGRVADSVGERLKRLAAENQVLAVTHLPQIACFADHHYAVEKFERAGRTFASVQWLATERERATELARMLSGRRITPEVMEHAGAMLKQGSRR